MPTDATTFAAAFALTTLALAAYLWRLERRGRALEARLRTLEAAKPKSPGGDGGPR